MYNLVHTVFFCLSVNRVIKVLFFLEKSHITLILYMFHVQKGQVCLKLPKFHSSAQISLELPDLQIFDSRSFNNFGFHEVLWIINQPDSSPGFKTKELGVRVHSLRKYNWGKSGKGYELYLGAILTITAHDNLPIQSRSCIFCYK